MDKILLIIQREYVTRVRKKAFIVMIFALPTLILVMSVVIGLVAKNSSELSELQTIKVIDKSGIFTGKFKNGNNIKFEAATKSLDSLKKDVIKDENLSILTIPASYNKQDSVQIYSKKKPSFVLTGAVEKQMNDIAVSDGMIKNHIDTAVISAVKKINISLKSRQVTEKGDQDANVGANMGVGIACAILIYLCLFIYGAQVMRGVIEEKTSRIIEVIISSVKPFQLMMGKIIGVGLVGLTQFAAWILLSMLATKIAGAAFSTPQGGMMGALAVLKTIPFGYIMGVFIFYFLTGYLLYSALFAAVGSAVDSETETQQFMFPITMPLLFTYVLSVSVLFQAPDSPLAVWLSMIPFTAPVAMMVRIPFGGVTTLQLVISMTLMVIGFLFTTYVAARIYRVGILMYGKKASFKELSKWFFYKE
jgi:ABC-2 type transport system permease protein